MSQSNAAVRYRTCVPDPVQAGETRIRNQLQFTQVPPSSEVPGKSAFRTST